MSSQDTEQFPNMLPLLAKEGGFPTSFDVYGKKCLMIFVWLTRKEFQWVPWFSGTTLELHHLSLFGVGNGSGCLEVYYLFCFTDDCTGVSSLCLCPNVLRNCPIVSNLHLEADTIWHLGEADKTSTDVLHKHPMIPMVPIQFSSIPVPSTFIVFLLFFPSMWWTPHDLRWDKKIKIISLKWYPVFG